MGQISEKIFKNKYHYITSPFGYRKHPITGQIKFHNGTDYGTNGKKTEQYAIDNGVVYSAGTDKLGGIYAWIEYKQYNIRILHYHLDSVVVKKGDKVNSNTLVGYTGTTGMSTGIHLHLTIYDLSTKKFLDPEIYKLPDVDDERDLKYKLGDEVILDGYLYKNSLGNGRGSKKTNYKCKITKVVEAPFPYNVNNGLGWVLENDLSLSENNTQIKIGDSVFVTGYGTASSDGSGNKTKNYSNTKMKVIDIVSNAVNKYGLNVYNSGKIKDRKYISAWFNKNNIKK